MLYEMNTGNMFLLWLTDHSTGILVVVDDSIVADV